MNFHSNSIPALLLTCCILGLYSSCDENNIHRDTLADGLWKAIEIQGVDTLQYENYTDLPGTHISFNICTKSMNEDWGTKNENYGECWMIVATTIDHQFTQDEYRFHIRNEESLEVKLLAEHSDRMLPDLTGPYTYHIDGRNMVLRYMGTDKPEIAGMEIHCWDWSPE